MNFSASRLSAPALLAVLFMLPTALHAASRSEVASPTSFQLLSSAGADTPACHGTLVACGNRALKGLIPPEGSSPRVAYSFTDETFSFDSGVDILLQAASTRQPAEQGAHMEWRWRTAWRKLGENHYRLIQTSIQYRCGSGAWLKTPCRPTGPVTEAVTSDFGASDITRPAAGGAQDAGMQRPPQVPGQATPARAAAAKAEAAKAAAMREASPSESDDRTPHTGRQAERRRAAKERLGLEGLDLYNTPEPQIQYRMPPTSPDAMRHAHGFMPLALGSDGGSLATAPCEKPIDLCGQQVLDEVYAADAYGKLSPEQIRHESFVYGDEDDGVIRAVYLVTLVDLPDDIIEGERVRIGFVRRGTSWVAVSAGRQVRCRFGYARSEWRGETCSP